MRHGSTCSDAVEFQLVCNSHSPNTIGVKLFLDFFLDGVKGFLIDSILMIDVDSKVFHFKDHRQTKKFDLKMFCNNKIGLNKSINWRS